MTEETHWFRAVNDTRLSSSYVDEWGDIISRPHWNPQGAITIMTFPVIRHTPKGAWLDINYGERWCSRDGLRSIAQPTIEDALERLRHRNRKYLGILQRKAKCCELLERDFDKASERIKEKWTGTQTMAVTTFR